MALSSRNILLNSSDKKKSSFIAKLLLGFKNKLKNSIYLKKSINKIIFEIDNIKNIKIEYLEIRNRNDLSRIFDKNNFKIFLAYYNKNSEQRQNQKFSNANEYNIELLSEIPLCEKEEIKIQKKCIKVN